ncbi:FG-GAP repeat domain-containing protein [Ramlibacter tataouinensis]|uniref:Uncharacterized protein n=1 Tax=Ramlibacter tataouinensis (strain ATCC BAA-407 / DSM 14655 / LMG 21543 / TTB310) TaxID=365046 RepID=F5Y6H2_RAMTT|nr:VCBS repeat-containing protein [Ramlibacter tataouinensis]AEG94046.1 hypothetical protein Rta_29430 [Ramlibacter tataouinensis TTB310]
MLARAPAWTCRLGAICCCWLLGSPLAAASSFTAIQVAGGDEARANCTGSPVAAAAAAGQQPTFSELLPGSLPVAGKRDIAWIWLGSSTQRYTHAALGSGTHAASLHAITRGQNGRELVLELPPERVIEDRLPRLADLDGDGQDEAIVVESHASRGAALVVYAIDRSGSQQRWLERARSEPVGAMRWLNPVGVADFDGDGHSEIASVSTPHIGGVLTLYRYAPPHLRTVARMGGVSNHRMGSPEQRLSAIVRGPRGPLVVVPDQAFARLLLLQWRAGQGWREAAAPVGLPAPVERMRERGEAVCVELRGGAWLRINAR